MDCPAVTVVAGILDVATGAKLFSVFFSQFGMLREEAGRMGHFQAVTAVAIRLLVADPAFFTASFGLFSVQGADLFRMGQIDLVATAAKVFGVADLASLLVAHAVSFLFLFTVDNKIGAF